MPRSPRATMIPPSVASTISSARSAACGFSIFAIRGISEPSSSSRSLTGPRSVGAAHEGDREQVDALAGREVDPAEVGPGDRRQARVAAGQVHALVGGELAADLDLGADLAGPVAVVA